MSSRMLKGKSAMGLSSTSTVLYRDISALDLDLDSVLAQARRRNQDEREEEAAQTRTADTFVTRRKPSPLDEDARKHRFRDLGGRSANYRSFRGRFSLSPEARKPLPDIFTDPLQARRARPQTAPHTGRSGAALFPAALSPRSEENLVRVQAQARKRRTLKLLPLARHAHYRGAQRRGRRQRLRQACATVIQKHFRGHFTYKNRDRIVEMRAQRVASVKMQRVVRGYLARAQAEAVQSQLRSALFCQTRFRGSKGRERYRAAKAEDELVKAELRRFEEEQERKRKEAELEAFRLQKERERAAAAEAARLRKEEEERKRKEKELRAFKKRQAAEREARRKAEEAAKAERERLAAEEAARVAAVEAEKARLAKLALEEECAKAEDLKKIIKGEVADLVMPATAIREALDQYLSIRQDATPHREAFAEVKMRLDRMEKLTALVSTMRTSDISEIRSFATPPKAILYILRQVYLLLGEPTKAVKAWINVSKLLGQKGKRTIQKRIQAFRVAELSPKRAADVEAKVQKFGQSVEEIATINKSVSLLFAWMQGVFDTVRSVEIVNSVPL